MSVLVLLIPPRPHGAAASVADLPAEWAWALSNDGRSVAAQGRGTPTGWPRADSVVAVLADADIAWHRVTLPKAPAARLRQALLGVLEEQLLDDDAQLHFALPPDAAAGRPTWVAVLHRPWLAALIARLESGGRSVDRVLPPRVPGGAAEGHFALAGGEGAAPQLSWVDADGALTMGLAGTLARARAAAAGDRPVRWTATPAAAAAAEAWLGQPVAVLGEAERALQAAQPGLSGPAAWNLRQFDLAPRRRGTTALRHGWLAFRAPAWRPVRVGLVALLAVHLVGLNAWAWQERRALQTKRTAMVALLQSTHPQVRAVLDAPLQMARETEALRVAAGQPGDDDLEALLGVAAAAWPDDGEPATSLRFEPGRLGLGVPDWDEAQVAALRERLAAAGWAVSRADGVLTLSRAAEARP
jgi:general secretion pathway protein L